MPQPAESTPAADEIPARWRTGTLVVFRFCFLYFGLCILCTQMISGLLPLPPLGFIPPLSTLTSWTATHVFGVTDPLVLFSGSGDKTVDWVQAFCVLVIAGAGTVAWSLAGRRRSHEARLHVWFHVFVRFALGATMIGYGMSKAIPLQMPEPSLLRLIEPFGNFSPMGVLWYSVGASRPYEIFTGCAELTGGILLLVPHTAVLGGLVTLATTIQVFTLNMTYDVPVKLLSFHLILLSLFVLAPNARRLIDVVVLNRGAGPSTLRTPGQRPRTRRWVTGMQIVFVVYLVVTSALGSVSGWYRYGGGAPRPALYGIWTVDEMTRDGVTLPPLLSDGERWRRVVIQTATSMTFQRMNEALVTYGAVIDGTRGSATLSRPDDKTWSAGLTFERPEPNRLVLDGDMDGHRLHMRLTLVERNSFLLVNRGFHWVQESPFNR
jgi:hypothetical protein